MGARITVPLTHPDASPCSSSRARAHTHAHTRTQKGNGSSCQDVSADQMGGCAKTSRRKEKPRHAQAKGVRSMDARAFLFCSRNWVSVGCQQVSVAAARANAVESWVDNYCRAHPLEDIADAAEEAARAVNAEPWEPLPGNGEAALLRLPLVGALTCVQPSDSASEMPWLDYVPTIDWVTAGKVFGPLGSSLVGAFAGGASGSALIQGWFNLRAERRRRMSQATYLAMRLAVLLDAFGWSCDEMIALRRDGADITKLPRLPPIRKNSRDGHRSSVLSSRCNACGSLAAFARAKT